MFVYNFREVYYSESSNLFLLLYTSRDPDFRGSIKNGMGVGGEEEEIIANIIIIQPKINKYPSRRSSIRSCSTEWVHQFLLSPLCFGTFF